MSSSQPSPITAALLAEQLLDAQVCHWVDRLTGDGFQAMVEHELDHFLDVIADIALADVVSAQQIKDTALTYAVDFPIQAAIPEIIGEIAAYVYHHEIHDQHRVGDLLSDQQALDYFNKLREMDALHQAIMQAVTQNPLYTDMLAKLLHQVLREFVAMNAVTRNLPGVTSMMRLGKDLFTKTTPELERQLDTLIKRFVRHNLNAVVAASQTLLLESSSAEQISDLLVSWWLEIRRQPIGAVKSLIGQDDLEDLIVLGFEHWKVLRKQSFYGAVIAAGIDFFFAKYGQTSLRELLVEVGVDKDTMIREAMRYGPPVLSYLNERGLLAAAVRRQLAEFYQSEAVYALLNEALAGAPAPSHSAASSAVLSAGPIAQPSPESGQSADREP